MRGLGTIINAGAIIAGGLLGLAGDRFLKKSMQDTLMKATGVCVMFIGIGGAIEEMMTVSGQSLVSGSTMMMIGSMDRVAADLLRRGKSDLGEKTEGGEYAAGDFGCSGLGLCVKMRPDTEEHKMRQSAAGQQAAKCTAVQTAFRRLNRGESKDAVRKGRQNGVLYEKKNRKQADLPLFCLFAAGRTFWSGCLCGEHRRDRGYASCGVFKRRFYGYKGD